VDTEPEEVKVGTQTEVCPHVFTEA
jgi:hypothetical protein